MVTYSRVDCGWEPLQAFRSYPTCQHFWRVFSVRKDHITTHLVSLHQTYRFSSLNVVEKWHPTYTTIHRWVWNRCTKSSCRRKNIFLSKLFIVIVGSFMSFLIKNALWRPHGHLRAPQFLGLAKNEIEDFYDLGEHPTLRFISIKGNPVRRCPLKGVWSNICKKERERVE